MEFPVSEHKLKILVYRIESINKLCDKAPPATATGWTSEKVCLIINISLFTLSVPCEFQSGIRFWSLLA